MRKSVFKTKSGNIVVRAEVNGYATEYEYVLDFLIKLKSVTFVSIFSNKPGWEPYTQDSVDVINWVFGQWSDAANSNSHNNPVAVGPKITKPQINMVVRQIPIEETYFPLAESDTMDVEGLSEDRLKPRRSIEVDDD